MVSLTIDGKDISVAKGSTILEAAALLGITIPTLCWLKKVSPTGACRVCAVEVEGVDRPMTACNTPVKKKKTKKKKKKKKKKIKKKKKKLKKKKKKKKQKKKKKKKKKHEKTKNVTQKPNFVKKKKIIKINNYWRIYVGGLSFKKIMELMMVNHPLDCPVCDAGGECDLQNACYGLGASRQEYSALLERREIRYDWPLIESDPNRCILCEKCVKVDHEVVGCNAIAVVNRGEATVIDTVDGKPLNCEFCGNCVGVCPTGTLIS